MANKTAWAAGNGAGLTWTTAFKTSATADLASLPTGDTVLSNNGAITNGTALDQYMDISVRCQIASNTIAAGANLALWLYALLDDGSTYGDGQLTAGTQAAKTPTFPPCAVIPLVAAASQTLLIGFYQGIILPPGSFLLAMQNNSGFNFTSTAAQQNCFYRTYNINLNA